MTKRQPRAGTGAKSTSVYLTDDEREAWERVSRDLNLSKKEALLRGLRALERGNDLTTEQVLDWIKRHGP
jgi:hypothetical protein